MTFLEEKMSNLLGAVCYNALLLKDFSFFLQCGTITYICCIANLSIYESSLSL